MLNQNGINASPGPTGDVHIGITEIERLVRFQPESTQNLAESSRIRFVRGQIIAAHNLSKKHPQVVKPKKMLCARAIASRPHRQRDAA